MRTPTILISQALIAAVAAYAGYRLADNRAGGPPAAIVQPAPEAPSDASRDRDARESGQKGSGAERTTKAPPPVGPGGTVSYREAVARAAPSVVTVYSARRIQRRSPFQFPFGGGDDARGIAQGLGSGVVIDDAGTILTNNHVVEGADEIGISLPGGEIQRARLIGSDPETDLALLHSDAKELKAITFGDPGRVAVGDVVLAVGNPLGVGQTVTQGIISATGRKRLGINPIENFIQTDAAINPGNSGGALVDTEGKLIGINTVILSRGGGFEGIGFAIPIDLAQRVATALAKKGKVARGWLGIAASDTGGSGARVVSLARRGPADRGGLEPGDVIVRLGEHAVKSADDVLSATLELEPGARVEVEVQRNGKSQVFNVELGRRPPLRAASRE